MLDRGLLITYEGTDASGKGTNVQLTKECLERMGFAVVVYTFPQYESTVGKVIANYLQGNYGDIDSVPHELVCTAYAADRARFAEDIATYLDNGYIVLCDRYTYSNAFTVAKMPRDQWDTFINWIEDLEFNCLNVIEPDYNIYLHVDPEISMQRIKERGKREYQNDKEDIHESNFNLLKTASEVYLYLAEQKDNWIVIDEMQDGKQLPIEDVFAKLFTEIYRILNKHYS